jgi:ABC-type multidrug transport system ATPase subunit
MSSGPVLRAQHLALHRGSRSIYSDFSLDLSYGVTAVLGPNGIGKTTLLEALADPEGIRRGTLELDGRRLGRELRIARYFAETGYLPQKWSSYRGFTVRDSISYVSWLKGLRRAASRDATNRVLRELDLENLASRRVHKLSGGMQQRVGIAEAFVHSPRMVFLDEPTVGLDPEQRAVVRSYLRAQALTCGVVISTHLTDDVEAIADRVIVLSGGQAIFDGSPAELAALSRSSELNSSPLEAGYLEVVRRANGVSAE